MVAERTQLRERASTELAKFYHSRGIIRSSLYRYAHRLSSQVELLCYQSRLFLEAAALGTRGYMHYLLGSAMISKRLLETNTIRF